MFKIQLRWSFLDFCLICEMGRILLLFCALSIRHWATPNQLCKLYENFEGFRFQREIPETIFSRPSRNDLAFFWWRPSTISLGLYDVTNNKINGVKGPEEVVALYFMFSYWMVPSICITWQDAAGASVQFDLSPAQVWPYLSLVKNGLYKNVHHGTWRMLHCSHEYNARLFLFRSIYLLFCL